MWYVGRLFDLGPEDLNMDVRFLSSFFSGINNGKINRWNGLKIKILKRKNTRLKLS
jgi:hypothetical protein